MPKKLKIPLPNGQVVDAVEVSYSIVKEEWNEYEMADGGRVRVKASVQKMLRVLDANGKGAVTEEGDPQVLVRSNIEVVSSS